MKKTMFRILMAVILSIVISYGLNRAGKTTQSQVDTNATIDITTLGRVVKDQVLIEHDVDLMGCVCKLPQGVTLVFKGGVIRNGTLIGNWTQLDCKGKAFDKVKIQGIWNVPLITTKMFVDLSYDNSLRDVVALSNPYIHNVIEIEKGHYAVRAEKEADVCIQLKSNTELELNGVIQIKPNAFKHYDIVKVKGDEIKIKGNGAIVGDKHTHKGSTGEWGMGLVFKGAVNSSVTGLTIRDCWGDCIYVGGNSQNVLIESCILDHGRRQGVTITKADGVTVKHCKITNVFGTPPEYGIDIEPNRNDSVDNILIEGVEVRNCEGGFLMTRKPQKVGTKTPRIGKIQIKNCSVNCKTKTPVWGRRCEEIVVEQCVLHVTGNRTAISITETHNTIVQNNSIFVSRNAPLSADKKKVHSGDGTNAPINLRDNKKSVVLNNIINGI